MTANVLFRQVVHKLITSCCAGAPMIVSHENRSVLVDGLEHVLIDVDALCEHILNLRESFQGRIQCLEAVSHHYLEKLPEHETSLILCKGLDALEANSLVYLALDSIALEALADRIMEGNAPAWDDLIEQAGQEMLKARRQSFPTAKDVIDTLVQ